MENYKFKIGEDYTFNKEDSTSHDYKRCNS